MTTYYVSSGSVDNGIVLSSGDTMVVQPGGTATNTTVDAGGQFFLSSGGAQSNTVIEAGGTASVLNGANWYDPSEVIYGTLNVYSGGTVDEEYVGSGGTLNIMAGATGDGAFFLNNSATLIDDGIISGYVEFSTGATGAVLEDRSTAAIVLSGNISAGDTVTVLNGANWHNPNAEVDGTLIVSSGGSTDEVYIGSGGTLDIVAGATGNGPFFLNSSATLIANGTINGYVSFLSGTTGAVIEDGTALNLASGTNVSAGDTVNVLNGGVFYDATGVDYGTVNIAFGGITDGEVVGSGGVLNISSGGTGEGSFFLSAGGTIIDNGTITGGYVDFTSGATGAKLEIGTSSFTSVISGFAKGEEIDLTGLSFSSATSATISGGTLTVTEGGSTYSLNFASALDGQTVLIESDGSGGTELVLCFYPGTRIATPSGETPVEALHAGDLVMTENGALPVRWIGESHISTRFADKLRVQPILIRAGALDGILPLRDLRLSPDHAIFIDGILVQAAALVNGTTIIRDVMAPEQFTYYHVELASHELLRAEGLAAESFVDNIDRMHFHNWNEREAPDMPIAEMPYPRAKAARQVPRALFERLAGRMAS